MPWQSVWLAYGNQVATLWYAVAGNGESIGGYAIAVANDAVAKLVRFSCGHLADNLSAGCCHVADNSPSNDSNSPLEENRREVEENRNELLVFSGDVSPETEETSEGKTTSVVLKTPLEKEKEKSKNNTPKVPGGD
jgi:hypothetical protein